MARLPACPVPVPRPGSKSATIFVNADKTLHKVQLSDILYLESLKDYVRIVLPDHKIMFLDNLKTWEHRLEGHAFARIHKSYLINLDRISKVYGNTVVLDQVELPIGRTYKDDFIRRITRDSGD